VNILLLANNDVGLYRFRRELLEALLREHTVILALPEGRFSQEFARMGCRVEPVALDRRGTNPLRDFGLFLRYRALIRKIKPDLALTYTVKPNVYGGLACRLSRVPVIANVTGLGTAVENGGPLRLLVMGLHRLGLKKARCVFFQNRHNQETMVSSGAVRGRTRLIPGSGVNLTENALEPYPEEGAGVRFLFIGRVMRNKGVEELLSAMARVKERHPGVSLTLVGEPDEDYESRLRGLESGGHLRYLGYRRDVHAQIAAAHCLVLPTYHEGMSNVLLEAASAGRPVIASRIPGCVEAFDEGVSGFGCEPRDSDSLLAAMERLIALPHAQRAEMGRRGRLKVEREFDRSLVVGAYMEEIDSIREEIGSTWTSSMKSW